MAYLIKFTTQPDPHDIQTLGEGISSYAKEQRGHKPIEPFGFFIRGENNQVWGGCNGNIGYDWIYIDQLWVHESLRGKGYGTKLMQAAEKLAKERGCVSAAVNTMDWEALGFYKKLGYQVEFERHGLAKNSIYYFLRKDLSQ